ncbi:sugar-transfer associated ATP-grasp domain-containing protein [Natronorarus salvus]|uniref:sugar-transfer associated ATP-grasp domain-containing protein n=1 Tax=Natronorarus salvus TaxID=3117733 RepID=UPI002F268A95
MISGADIVSLSWNGAKTAQRKALGWTDLAMKEKEVKFRDDIPLKKRLSFYRNGFATSSGILYNFDKYSFEDYLNDVNMRHRKRANGHEQAFPTRKYPFHLLMESSHPEYLPELYGLVTKGKAYTKDLVLKNEDAEDWLRRKLKVHGKIVIKPENGNGGVGVYVLVWNGSDVSITGGPETIGDLMSKIGDSVYIAVEFVEQADYAASIYPDSVNTIRLITLWDYDLDEPYVADAIHRFGNDGSAPVDNWDSGGLSVGVDLDSGTLLQAVRFPESTVVEWYREHPNTGAEIEGIKIPQWDRICTACCEMAETFWYVPMNAWDIVLSHGNIKVIEGNSRPTIEMMQVHRPFLADKRTRRFFEYHDAF